jgi:hypothetical protein
MGYLAVRSAVKTGGVGVLFIGSKIHGGRPGGFSALRCKVLDFRNETLLAPEDLGGTGAPGHTRDRFRRPDIGAGQGPSLNQSIHLLTIARLRGKYTT